MNSEELELLPEHSKKLKEMLKYIVSRQISDHRNDSINAIDSVVYDFLNAKM